MAQAYQNVQAARDLLEIWVYIAEQDMGAADRLMEKINITCKELADMPGMGRQRNELLAGLRSFPVGNYLIYYRVIPEGLEVMRVLHGARDIENLFPMGNNGR